MEKSIFLFLVCLVSILATPLPMVSPDQRYVKREKFYYLDVAYVDVAYVTYVAYVADEI
jgi:hypothetical protein